MIVIFFVWIVYIPLEQKANLNLEYSEDTKILELNQSGLSMSTISSFKSIENKHDVHRVRDCVKTFCESLREIAMKIIDFKKIKSLTNEQWKSYENAKKCYICKEKFEDKSVKDKKYRSVKEIVIIQGEYRGAEHSICNLKCT